MKLADMLTDPQRVEAWKLGDSELLSDVPDVSTAILKLEALRVRLVHETDRRRLPEHIGAADTATWLAATTRIPTSQAKKIVTRGEALPQHPQMSAVFDDGRIQLAHTTIILTFLTRLATLTKDFPREVNPPPTDWDNPDPHSGRPDDAEAYLLIAAQLEDADELRKRARALEILFERAGTTPPDAENPELNELFASTTLGGRMHVKGTFDAETGEAINTALSGLSTPRPSTDNDGNPVRDPRTAAKRRADALADIVRGHLDNGRGPTEAGERPHVTVTIDFDALLAAVTTAQTPPATGAWGHNGWDYHQHGGSGPVNTGGPGYPRPPTHPGPSSNPGNRCSGRRDQHRQAHATMAWHGPISPEVAARLSCDAMVTAIIVDSNGTPLDVGTTTRIIPTRIRKALVARDHGCAFPGCGRPAEWTDAHHIWHWAQGGPTALSNLVLLCRKHHTMIHKNHWDIILGEDKHPWFIPPAWVDPLRRPRPAHNRRHLHPVA